MISRWVDSLVQHMQDAKLIRAEDAEGYAYVLLRTIEQVVTVITIFMISIVIHNTFGTAVFLLFFLKLRKYTNGYHADCFWKCYIGTILIYCSVSVLAMQCATDQRFLFWLMIVAFIGIEYIGTVNSESLSLTEQEFTKTKRRARVTAAIEFCLILIGLNRKMDAGIVNDAMLALILCFILILLAKITKQEV